jgi:two-component system, OmpR family, alkaline phosphatase synthesis response regulator PhoP
MNERAPSRTILLVEDEESLVMTLGDRLRANGFDVEVAMTGNEGLEMGRRPGLDLIILDVSLPGKNGFDICRDLRHEGVTTPILMLTARGQVIDKVLGLKLGADDYVTKPFDLLELEARVEAILRRGRAMAGHADMHVYGSLRVDFRSAEVSRDGVSVELSGLELRLLRYFIEHRGAVLTRNELLDKVWGYESMPTTRTVDVHVASLRQKIEANPSQPELIVTVHGMGYKFVG